MITKQLKYQILIKNVAKMRPFFIVFSQEHKKGHLKISNALFKANKQLIHLQDCLLRTSSYLTYNASKEDKIIFFATNGHCFYPGQMDLTNTNIIICSINKSLTFYNRFFFLLKLISVEK